MITFEMAKSIYKKQYPNYLISSAVDVGDEYVFSSRDKESGEELDISPIAINKDSGAIRVFFPPLNIDKLKNAITINMESNEYE